MVFTADERTALLNQLVSRARADPTITGAALVGSAARRATDAWSDIDLALELAGGVSPTDAAERWTAVMRERAGVADTVDLWAGPALYRVFLLDDSLQVDVSFWPAGTLVATQGQPLAQLFGRTAASVESTPTDRRSIIGWGWLYALHARSAIARGRPWQALAMMDRLREQLIMLCCLRHGLPDQNGRGVDQLPETVRDSLVASLPTDLERLGLTSVFTATLRLFSEEIAHVDRDLAERLSRPLTIMETTAAPAKE